MDVQTEKSGERLLAYATKRVRRMVVTKVTQKYTALSRYPPRFILYFSTATKHMREVNIGSAHK